MDKNQLTFGERACGVSFNPGGNEAVASMKKEFAELVNTLNHARHVADDPDVKRMLSIAITEVQTAQMWAVKAITWNL